MQSRDQTDKPAQPTYEDRLVAINYPSNLIPNEYLGIISLEVVNNPLLICTGYTCLIEKDNLLQMWASSANKKKFHPIGLEDIPKHSIKTVPHIENAILAFVERQEQIHSENPPFEAQKIFHKSCLMEKHIAKKIFEYNKKINLREFYIEELNILLDKENCNNNPPKTISAALIDRIKSLFGYSETKSPDTAMVTELIKKIELLNFHLKPKNSPDPYIRQKQIYQLLNLGLSDDKIQGELDKLLKFNLRKNALISRRHSFQKNKLYLFSTANLYEENSSLRSLLNRLRQEGNHPPTIKPGGLMPED